MDNKELEQRPKLTLNFQATNQNPDILKSEQEYVEIWEDEGSKITNALVEATGLGFKET